MFTPSQANVRQFFCTVYAKSLAGTPLDAAVALGILASELSHEAFRGLLLTYQKALTYFVKTHAHAVSIDNENKQAMSSM